VKFAEFVCNDAIKAELATNDKEGVVRELAQALLDIGRISLADYNPIVAAVLEREKLGSTGIGRGAAIPHAKHSGVERSMAAIGVSQTGVDFASLDGESVFVFFLLLSPADAHDDHLMALQCTASRLRSGPFSRFLQQATSVEEIRQLLIEADDDKV
jgi:PTS system fructose-specific IIA component/PTS system nitrogen regulatory IIA component